MRQGRDDGRHDSHPKTVRGAEERAFRGAHSGLVIRPRTGGGLGSPTVVLAQTVAFTAEEQSLARAEMIDAAGQHIGAIAFVATPGGLTLPPPPGSGRA